jgi:hypothetical protein
MRRKVACVYSSHFFWHALEQYKMHLHCEQNVALWLSHTVHDCTAGVSDMAMRGAGIGEAAEWYLYDRTGRIASIR